MDTQRFQYFIPDLPQKRLGAYITVAGLETFGKGDVFPSALHNSYYYSVGKGRRLEGKEHQILYIRSGRGKVEFAGGKSIPIKAGNVNILRPGEWHRHEPDQETGWSEVYVGLGGDMVERVVQELFPKPDPVVLDFSSDTRVDADMVSLVEEILSDGEGKPHSLALKALSLLASLVERAHHPESVPTTYTTVRRGCLYIAHHLDEALDFESISRRFGMGYSLFRRLFRTYTGFSPLAYQLSLRMRRAKRLLRGTDTHISDIAKSLGFQSQAYFARFFRKETGMSPRSYRANAQRT